MVRQDIEHLGGRAIGLSNDAERVGHEVSVGCEVEEVLVAPALVLDGPPGVLQLLILLAQLLLGHAEFLHGGLEGGGGLLPGVFAAERLVLARL